MLGVGLMNNLHQKRVTGERVVVHLHSCNISNDLQDHTTNHTPEESPSVISNPQKDLNQQEKSENGDVQCISSEGWHVLKVSLQERTSGKSA